MHTTTSLALFSMLVLAMAGLGNTVLASEITGTLSTDPSQTTMATPSTPNTGAGPATLMGQWFEDWEKTIQAVIIALLAAEILTLMILTFRKRRRTMPARAQKIP